MLAAVLGWVLPCQSTLKSLHKMQIDLEWVWRAVYKLLESQKSLQLIHNLWITPKNPVQTRHERMAEWSISLSIIMIMKVQRGEETGRRQMTRRKWTSDNLPNNFDCIFARVYVCAIYDHRSSVWHLGAESFLKIHFTFTCDLANLFWKLY